MKLSVVIPAYNEGERIIKTLESLVEYLNKQSFESEVLVVANGCTDNTVEVAKSFDGKMKNLNVMDVIAKGGKGYAVRIGMEKAQGDVAVFMDADNATKISEMDSFWKYFNQGYDVIIGSRALKESKIVKKQPFYRVLLGRAGNFLIQVLLLPGIKDTQCGFKVFTKKAYRKIFPLVSIFGWGFDFEALAIARNKGFNIKEAPITWHDQGESKVEPVGAAVNTLKELFIIRKNLLQGKYGKVVKKRKS